MPDRRQNSGRRTGFDRRTRRDAQRSTRCKTVVVEITGSELHVVTLSHGANAEHGRVEAATVPWKDQATTLNSEQGFQELRQALHTIAENHPPQDSRFHFVLGGKLCVTKAVRGSSELVRNEVREIEERSQLYLSLGPGEKVMVAHTQPLDARHDYAVAAVCNRATLNTIYDAATEIGLNVQSIEPALVSVCRVVHRLPDVPAEPCLLMLTDTESIEVGVYHEGKLLLDYRPGGRNCTEDVGNVVHTHVSRLQRHTSRQLRCAAPELKTVYLCGNEQSVKRAMGSFKPYPQFQVLPISPAKVQATWESSESVQDTAMVPALGMMLGSYQLTDKRDAPDFMQHIVASTREPMAPVLYRSLVPIAATLLLGLVGYIWNAMEHNSLDLLREQISEMQVVEGKSRELRLRLTAAEQKLYQLNRLIEGIDSQPMKHLVARVGHCMPSDVWLTDLHIQEMDKVTLSGSSILEGGVFTFVEYLGKVPEFADVALRSTSPGASPAGPVVDFSIEINLDGSDGPASEVARNE